MESCSVRYMRPNDLNKPSHSGRMDKIGTNRMNEMEFEIWSYRNEIECSGWRWRFNVGDHVSHDTLFICPVQLLRLQKCFGSIFCSNKMKITTTQNESKLFVFTSGWLLFLTANVIYFHLALILNSTVNPMISFAGLFKRTHGIPAYSMSSSGIDQ